MADDSLEIITPIDYHPCDTPRGCTYYDTALLTDCQQFKLNKLKLSSIKSDEKYLHMHPEIRGYIALITRYVFKKQPRRNVAFLIKEFFDRPHHEIDMELENYLSTRPPVEPEVEGGIEEEEVFYQEDFSKYLSSLQPPIEENSYLRPRPVPADEITSEEFIKQLLLDRVRQFPSVVHIKDESPKSSFGSDVAVPKSIIRTSTRSQNMSLTMNRSNFISQKSLPVSKVRISTSASKEMLLNEDNLEPTKGEGDEQVKEEQDEVVRLDVGEKMAEDDGEEIGEDHGEE